MAEEFVRYFTQLMNMVEGINAIIVTDREGVSVLQVRALTVTDATLRPQHLSTAPVTMEQASKIGLGQARTVMAFFDNSQMISFNKMPLTVTVLADKNANTGHILALDPDISTVIQLMKPVVENGNC